MKSKVTKISFLIVVPLLIFLSAIFVPEISPFTPQLLNTRQDEPCSMPYASLPANLAIWDATDRGVPKKARGVAYEELFTEVLAPELGGKGAWDSVLSDLAPKIGFKHPGSIRLTIKEAWKQFIEANQELIDECNKIIVEEAGPNGEGTISDATLQKLQRARRKLDFPKELRVFIREHTKELKGWVITRSSGRWEDAFLQSAAGVFISPRQYDERLVTQGVREIFDQAIETIWENQATRKEKFKGVPFTLNVEEGFGVVVQPFISFISSGTAKTNYYGHTSVECVFGDADLAVRGGYANTSQFLFEKGSQNYNYTPSFLSMPHQLRICSEEVSSVDNPARMREIMDEYPKIGENVSPVSDDEILELYRVVGELEEEVGTPLDVEWGYFMGELYIIQIRPIDRSLAEKELVKPQNNILELKKNNLDIAHTPIALGNTEEDSSGRSPGFTGKMVLIGRDVGRHTIANFETVQEDEYIRVQYDVASHVLEGPTKAKVLVDADQGSRQAHNVTLIEDRIGEGEFSYCSGPILKEGFLKNLNFIPHPSGIEGIWVSREDVTYFCDGLQGTFFKASEPVDVEDMESTGDGDNDKKIWDLNIIQHAISDSMDPANEQDLMGLAKDILKFLTLGEFDFLMEYAAGNEGLDQKMEEHLKIIEDSGIGREYVFASLTNLRDILNIPIVPLDWEMEWLKPLRNVTVFLDDYELWKKEKDVHKVKTGVKFHVEEPYKLRILHYEDSALNRKLIEGIIRQLGSPEEYELVQVNDRSEALKLLNESNFDLLIYDWQTPEGPPTEEDEDVILDVPFAVLYAGFTEKEFLAVSTKRLYEHTDFFEKGTELDQIKDYIRGCREKKIDVIEQMYQEPPEKLRVLIVDDEESITTSTETLLRLYHGDAEYEYVTVNSVEEAMSLLEGSLFDVVITDYAMKDFNNNYQKAIARISTVYMLSGRDKSTIPSLLIPELRNKVIVVNKSGDIESLGILITGIKECRRNQVDEFERIRSLLSGMKIIPKPELPKKLNIIYITDKYSGEGTNVPPLVDELGLKSVSLTKYSSETINIFLARSPEEAEKIFYDEEIEYIVLDWTPYISKGTPGREKVDRVNKIVTKQFKDKKAKYSADLARLSLGKVVRGISGIIFLRRKVYEAQLEEWEMNTGKIEPIVPRKLRVLLIQDHPIDGGMRWAEKCRQVLSSDTYEIIDAGNFWQAMNKLAEEGPVDCCIADLMGTGVQENYNAIRTLFGQGVYGFAINSLGISTNNPNTVKTRRQEIIDGGFPEDLPIGINVGMIDYIRESRRRQEEKYDKLHRMWREKVGLEQDSPEPVKDTDKKTVFIIDNSSEKALELSEYIEENADGSYNTYHMDSPWSLQRQLRKHVPDIVITDAIIEGKEELDNIMSMVKEVNPEVQFIVMGEDAAVRSRITGRKDKARRTLEDSYRIDIDDIRLVKDRGRYALSDKAKQLLLNPDNAARGVNFDPKVYYELYTFLNPLNPTEEALELMRTSPELFNMTLPTVNDQVRSLLKRIVQAAVLNAMYIDAEELEKLKLKIILSMDTTKTRAKKYEKLSRSSRGFAPGENQAPLNSYIAECYKIRNEVVVWSHERTRAKEGLDIGIGDEHDFFEGVPIEVYLKYIEDYDKLRLNVWESIATAKGYVVRGDISKGIMYFKQELLESLDEDQLAEIGIEHVFLLPYDDKDKIDELYEKANKFWFKGEALWEIQSFLEMMRDKKIDGALDIARALGIERVTELFAGNENDTNIVAIVEKPFHFNDIVEILNGTYEKQQKIAEDTYRIEESGRVRRSISEEEGNDEVRTIRIWSGYVAPQFQDDLMQRVIKYSKDGPYKIEVIEDLDTLVLQACDDQDSGNSVTILPFEALGEDQKDLMAGYKPKVIFMDFEKNYDSIGVDDFSHLSGIVFSGIAYLNEDDDAFTKLYYLLTDDDEKKSIKVQDVKRSPENFKFILRTPAQHDYAGLRKLNRIMERVLTAA